MVRRSPHAATRWRCAGAASRSSGRSATGRTSSSASAPPAPAPEPARASVRAALAREPRAVEDDPAPAQTVDELLLVGKAHHRGHMLAQADGQRAAHALLDDLAVDLQTGAGESRLDLELQLGCWADDQRRAEPTVV